MHLHIIIIPCEFFTPALAKVCHWSPSIKIIIIVISFFLLKSIDSNFDDFKAI